MSSRFNNKTYIELSYSKKIINKLFEKKIKIEIK